MIDEAKNFERDASINPENQNRGFDTAFTSSDPEPLSVTLYKIDETILNYIKNIIKPSITVNNELKAVPVIFANQEKWKTIRIDGVYRDKDDKIQTPLIVIGRPRFSRNQLASPVNKYLSHTYEMRWNRKTSYDRFNVLNGITPPRQLVAVTMPDYINIEYEIMIWTSFEEHMNPLVERFNFESDDFWGERGSFKFRVSIENFEQDNQLPSNQDRLIRSVFTLNVRAYLLSSFMIDRNKKYAATSQKLNSVKKVVSFIESESDTLP